MFMRNPHTVEVQDEETGEVTVARLFRTPGGGPIMTKQSHKQECDMYSILHQFNKTGVITHINERKGQFLDLPDGLDFFEAQLTLARGREAFAALPASVRDHFNNDAGRFLAAFSDPEQLDKLREFGFVNPATPVADPPSEPYQGSS